MQVKCKGTHRSHSNVTDKGQENPNSYLHLPGHRIDIRGSRIALYFRYNKVLATTAMIAINLMDGRWSKSAEEVEVRIKEILNGEDHSHIATDPFFIHLVYLTSLMRWWTNALDSVHEQLITYESQLQDDKATLDAATQQNISKELHTMAAHLHRYTSELASIEDTIAAISKHHTVPKGDESQSTAGRVVDGIQQIFSQLKAVQNFRCELDKKAQNALALVTTCDHLCFAFSTDCESALQPYPARQRPYHGSQQHSNAADLTRNAGRDQNLT